MRLVVGIMAVLVILWWYLIHLVQPILVAVVLLIVGAGLAAIVWRAGSDRSPATTVEEAVVARLQGVGQRTGPRLQLVAIVAVWTVVAVVAVTGLAIALSALDLTGSAATIGGLAMGGTFLGLLVLGPLVTLRWIRR